MRQHSAFGRRDPLAPKPDATNASSTAWGEIVTWNTMILSESDPNHLGFVRRYYATIDIFASGNNWAWCQVDTAGNYVGSQSKFFQTEDDAKNDALQVLNGDWWE
jgi:hypothetical protein